MKKTKIKQPRVMIWFDTARGSDRAVFRGIVRYAQSFGPWIFYHRYPAYMESSFYNGRTISVMDCLKTWKPDGLIALVKDRNVAEKISSTGVPMVVIPIEHIIEAHTNITDNTGKTGKIAAEYFLDRGFKQFAFCGFSRNYWSQVRGQAFSKTLAEHGYDLHIYRPPENKGGRWESELPCMIHWLKSLPRPIGLLACNDERGQHVLEACNVADLSVPDDIAVLGVDNDEIICNVTEPPLSSIALNVEKCGYEAAGILRKLMNGEQTNPEQISVEPISVVSRQSTNLLAIEDQVLADVLRYIREHAREKLNVNEIVKFAAVSRHVLYRKFRKTLKRTPHEELLRIRINEIAQMLVTTNLSLLEISHIIGEQDEKHIARCFRRIKGMTPSAYRKKYVQNQGYFSS